MGTIKKRVKRRLPIVFIFLFLLVGIAIFMYPKVSNWLSVYTSRVEIGSYNNAVKEMDNSQIEALEKKANDYNEALARKDTQTLSVINYEALLTVTDAIGYVDIPKINIYLPIFHDMSDEVLQKGVGHMEGTSLPVGGKSTHAVLPAAHSCLYLWHAHYSAFLTMLQCRLSESASSSVLFRISRLKA